jgi:hypothetical protein
MNASSLLHIAFELCGIFLDFWVTPELTEKITRAGIPANSVFTSGIISIGIGLLIGAAFDSGRKRATRRAAVYKAIYGRNDTTTKNNSIIFPNPFGYSLFNQDDQDWKSSFHDDDYHMGSRNHDDDNDTFTGFSNHGDDDGFVSSSSSFNDDFTVNPANGLPMIGGIGGIDIDGNPFGCSSSTDDLFSSTDDSFGISGSSFDDCFSSCSCSSCDDICSSFSDCGCNDICSPCSSCGGTDW